MNVVFISPHFPLYFHNFCSRLKERGVNVLGIGDEDYNLISNEAKNAVTEYYKVSNLENFEEVENACKFYENKYGKIDWIESQNEYWLEMEATLRSKFNVNTGTKIENMSPMKYKSKMKDVYKKANKPVARYDYVKTLESCIDFANKVGYPIIAKPDNGVGANSTYKLNNEDEIIWPSMNNNYYNENGKCYGLITHLGILVDGTIVPCCLDTLGIINLGNIFKDDLSSLKENKLCNEMINGFKNNKKVHELCKKCKFL